jgi:hypothetical protein
MVVYLQSVILPYLNVCFLVCVKPRIDPQKKKEEENLD